jgi:Protein of unknown function (DUF3035)
MRKSLLPLGVISLCAIPLISGCGSTGLMDRDRPDEFAVTRSAPLKVPGEFTLPAPQPGTAPQQADTKAQMLDAMFGPPQTKP